MKVKIDRGRAGAAAIWTMLVIAIVTVMIAATTARFTSARRQTEAYQQRTQCEWLARTGYEIAVAKVIADPEGYPGETIAPIEKCEVKIAVQRDPDTKGVYRVTSEARFPLGTRGSTATVSRSFRRIAGANGIRIEPLPDKP